MRDVSSLGFIGLGVMGEPICRNLATKSGLPMVAFDPDPTPLERLAAAGVKHKDCPAEVAQAADLIFLSLPDGDAVRCVCLDDEDGLMEALEPGQIVVDTGTTPVELSREVALRYAKISVAYADAPVARTRAAAEAGTLSVMVGADAGLFERLEPYLGCFASEITLCGETGAGQVVKQMNNMVLFQTVVALAEALAVGRRAGVDGKVLFDTLSKGSADSFALRNHGMKAMLPGEFPERAFPARYALKDLSYALGLADDIGLELRGADVARQLLEEAIANGDGDRYFPALARVIDPRDD